MYRGVGGDVGVLVRGKSGLKGRREGEGERGGEGKERVEKNGELCDEYIK